MQVQRIIEKTEGGAGTQAEGGKGGASETAVTTKLNRRAKNVTEVGWEG